MFLHRPPTTPWTTHIRLGRPEVIHSHSRGSRGGEWSYRRTRRLIILQKSVTSISEYKMYTEIKELVNFLARYLFNKIPRRKVCLFTEQLANFILMRLTECEWEPMAPTQGERCRVIHLIHNGMPDNQVQTAATIVGIEPEEVARFLPPNIIIYVSPGQVTYRVNENAQLVPIWCGPVDADDRYCSLPQFVTQPVNGSNDNRTNLGAAGKTVYFGKNESDREHSLHDFVPLQIQELNNGSSAENPELVHQKSRFKNVFQFVPKDQAPYTVEQFALTRFGSHRQRPDHEVMRRIQKQAAFKQIMNVNTPPVMEAPPPLFSHPPPSPPSPHTLIGDHSSVGILSDSSETTSEAALCELSRLLHPSMANALVNKFKMLSAGNDRPPEDCLKELLSSCMFTPNSPNTQSSVSGIGSGQRGFMGGYP